MVLNNIIIPPIIFLITVISGYIVRKVLFKKLTLWSQRTSSSLDDIIIESIKGPFIIWFIMLEIYFGLEFSVMPEEMVRIAGKALVILGIISATLVFANISTRFIHTYSGNKLSTGRM